MGLHQGNIINNVTWRRNIINCLSFAQIINMMDYGGMDGAKVLKHAREAMGD